MDRDGDRTERAIREAERFLEERKKLLEDQLDNFVQQLVDRTGWSSGNSMSFVLAGTGSRVADAWDSNPATAPQFGWPTGS